MNAMNDTCGHDNAGYPVVICGSSDPDVEDGCGASYSICHNCMGVSTVDAAAKTWQREHRCKYCDGKPDYEAIVKELDELASQWRSGGVMRSLEATHRAICGVEIDVILEKHGYINHDKKTTSPNQM